MKSISLTGILTACVAVVLSMSATASADPLACSLAAYKASPGMTATVDGTALTLTWDGEANGEVRMRLAINNGTPTIQDVSVRKKGGAWATVAGGQFGWTLPLAWFAVSPLAPHDGSTVSRVTAWLLQPPETAPATWTAVVLAVLGVVSYTGWGGRR